MFKSHILRFLGFGESPYLHETPGGGGTGQGTGVSGGSGTGTGSGAGAAAPIVLSGDSLVDFGDGKPVKWSEASNPQSGRYVERSRYDEGVKYLTSEAQRLQAAWDKYHEGTGARPNKAEPAASGPDPLEGIRDMPVVDGRTLERLYTSLQQKGLGPIAQIVAQMAGRLQQLEGNVGKIGKTTGSLDARTQSEEFENFISKSFSAPEVASVKGLPEGVTLDAKNDYLREAAKDLYLSHDPNSWKPGEFQKQLATRLSSMIQFVRDLDKQAVEAGRAKKRVWLNPVKGGAHPSGQPGYQHKRGADIARQFFEGQPQNT